jgi:cytoskeletal protein RodZ
MLVALMILISFSTVAQACWPPANTSENSGDNTEPVKAVEPVYDEQDAAAGEEQESGGSDDPESEGEAAGSEEPEVEVVAPVVDTVDQDVTEESDVVETPVSETVTETVTGKKILRSSGYGEARIVEITATAVQLMDTENRSVNNGSASMISGTDAPVEQIAEVHTDSNGNTDNKDITHAAGGALALVSLIAGTAYYFKK